jgi:peptidoglycan/LPS O-acetylase OafA/YrhL
VIRDFTESPCFGETSLSLAGNCSDNRSQPLLVQQNSQKYVGLDVLRGCAAIAVLLLHASQESLHVSWLMPSGALAVDVFFVMSGFVVAHSYDKRIPTLGTMGFLRLRAIRFYPLYLLGLVLGTIRAIFLLQRDGQLFNSFDIAAAILAGLAFLPASVSGLLGGSIAPLNAPGWSLIFEIWVNALYSLCFKYLTNKNIMIILGVAAAALIIYGIFGQTCGGNNWNNIPLGVFRIVYSFSLGVILYRYRTTLPQLKGRTVLVISLLLASFMLPENTWFNLLFILVLSPIIVLLASYTEYNKRIAVYFGATSYCIYIIHWPILIFGAGLGKRVGAPASLSIALVILFLLCLAPLLDTYYDKLMRNKLSSFGVNLHFWRARLVK